MISGPRARLLLASTVAFASVAVVVSACSTSGEVVNPLPEAGTGDGGVDGSQDSGQDASQPQAQDAAPDVLVAPNLPRDAGEDALAPLRAACAFEAGAWPAETIGNEYPIGTDIPINHVIVIMQENRSFDHYYGRLVAQGYYQAGNFTTPPVDAGPGDSGPADSGGSDASEDASEDAATMDAGAPDAAPPVTVDAGVPGSGFLSSTQLDVDPPGWAMPDSDGGLIAPHPDDQYCYGVGHSWNDQHGYWDNGKNDGFAIGNSLSSDNSDGNDPLGGRTMFYEDDTVIPFYYALANDFAIGDRYFCSVLSSTWPNRFFLMAATSYGIGDNSICTLDTVQNPAPQIFNEITAAGHSWKDYTDGPHMEQFYPNFGFSEDVLKNHYGSVDCTLMKDITNGTLPDVAFIMGDEVTESSDEGPSDLPGVGGAMVEQIVRGVMASSSWKDTAIFIVYDENGGIADHVPPAPACEPDSYPPHDQNNNPFPGAFNTTGFRVPMTVISPYAKAHYVSHVVHDHTSITRFIEARFGLPALTARDANTAPPMEMFDFKNPPFMTPPNITATTTVPPAILTQCGQSMAPSTCPQ